jgi:glycosyltransferase involved in cell wall biosynthesis
LSAVRTVKYSVVAPMHNEAENVSALYDDIKKTMDALEQLYEVIFVNDASTDETIARLAEIQSRDPQFHFADLEANVGENWALLAGVSQARGEIIITIDGDYQNDPAYIPGLLRELSKGYRVVSGRRQSRVAALWSRRLPSLVANGVIRALTGVRVHDCGCGLKAYRREVLEGKYVPKGFMNRFSPVALGVGAHEFAEVEIVDRPRQAGQSHYGLGRIFVVLRDLWALPFALRGGERWLWRFRVLQWLGLVCAIAAAVWGGWLTAAAMFLLGVVASSNVIKLKAFVEAKTKPKFRIREYR